MKQPKSLDTTRARALLPKRTGRGFEWPSITEEEALYINHLDASFTFTEVASCLLGIADVSLGMLLVRAAERKVGDALPKIKQVTNILKAVRQEEDDEATLAS